MEYAGSRLPEGRARSFEVRPGIYEVLGLDPDLPVDDLAALRLMVGDAEVVALGESAHTSGGYYRAKHRLFRFLVEELGFRAFTFESPWTDAELVKHYVETCEGSAADAVIGGLFDIWASRSVVEMLEWPGVGSGLLPPPSGPDQVEYVLHHELGHAYLLVDLAYAGPGEPFLIPGQRYVVSNFGAVPAHHFGALFYLDVPPQRDLNLWP